MPELSRPPQVFLQPHHRKLLKESAISDEVIAARGYESALTKAELGRLGFAYSQRIVPALVLPLWGIDGQSSLNQIRPDQPRVRNGKPAKYEVPSGSTLQIDVPPMVAEKVKDATLPLYITEGIRKADAAVSAGLACLGLIGVEGWRNSESFWQRIPLKGRTVYIVFDSDISTNANVQRAAASLYAHLESLGATVRMVLLPAVGDQKVGLDDYLAAGNSVESLLSHVTLAEFSGNIILVVDDFVPTGSQAEIERAYKSAEDVLRGQGNAAGKGRCNRDGTPREAQSPRGLVLSTGEVRPSGHSLSSRVLCLEVFPGDIADPNVKKQMDRLGAAQANAASGSYAKVMASFIQWIAGSYDAIQHQMDEQIKEIRRLFGDRCKHARSADMVAKLLTGLDVFLVFAEESGAITQQVGNSVWDDAVEAFGQIIEEQDRENNEEDPTTRFFDLLRSVFNSGRAHIEVRETAMLERDRQIEKTHLGYQARNFWVPDRGTGDTRPDGDVESVVVSDGETSQAEIQREEDGGKGSLKTTYIARGERIGWLGPDSVYLEPKTALAVVQRLARDMGSLPIPMNHKALGKRLKEKNLLITHGTDRNTCRRTIDGQRIDVFEIPRHILFDMIHLGGDYCDEQFADEAQEQEESRKWLAKSDELRAARIQRGRQYRDEQFTKLLNLE